MVNKLSWLLLGALLVAGAGCRRPQEPVVIRLLDLAASAESSWPRERPEFVPKRLGVRTFRQLRAGKVGRVAMLGDTGGDSRRVLIAPTGTKHRFVLDLPPNSSLRVGLGYAREPEDEESGVRFVVRVSSAQRPGREKVVDQMVTTRTGGDWTDLEIDLSQWSGQEVHLDFLTSAGGSDAPVWASWSAPEITAGTGSQSGPDVILISLDTLRADRLGSYGYGVDTSPNLDRLAARGIRFGKVVSQAPWTLPSHRSLLSGIYPTARDLAESPTLAEVLLGEGYRTEALTGGGQMDFRMGFAEGFESYRVFDWIRNMDWLREWLRRSGNRKRFLFLHTYEIHDPYIHTEFTEGKSGGRAEGYFDKRTWFRSRGQLTDEEKDYVGSLYDGGIAYTDRQLGELFAMLEESGALERSIVIVTSDHGEQFWEHGSWRHGMNLYDHQLLVPLIVHLPKRLESSFAAIEGGAVFDQQVRLVDVFPTILDLLGVPIEHPINGRSLKPLFEGATLPAVDAFSEKLNVETRESKALRTERYKFIYSFPKARGVARGLEENWELYDLVKDPSEHENLADRYPEEVEQLEARLRTLLDLLADPSDLESPATDLDPDLMERLRALGYLGD